MDPVVSLLNLPPELEEHIFGFLGTLTFGEKAGLMRVCKAWAKCIKPLPALPTTIQLSSIQNRLVDQTALVQTKLGLWAVRIIKQFDLSLHIECIAKKKTAWSHSLVIGSQVESVGMVQDGSTIRVFALRRNFSSATPICCSVNLDEVTKEDLRKVDQPTQTLRCDSDWYRGGRSLFKWLKPAVHPSHAESTCKCPHHPILDISTGKTVHQIDQSKWETMYDFDSNGSTIAPFYATGGIEKQTPVLKVFDREGKCRVSHRFTGGPSLSEGTFQLQGEFFEDGEGKWHLLVCEKRSQNNCLKIFRLDGGQLLATSASFDGAPYLSYHISLSPAVSGTRAVAACLGSKLIVQTIEVKEDRLTFGTTCRLELSGYSDSNWIKHSDRLFLRLHSRGEAKLYECQLDPGIELRFCPIPEQDPAVFETFESRAYGTLLCKRVGSSIQVWDPLHPPKRTGKSSMWPGLSAF